MAVNGSGDRLLYIGSMSPDYSIGNLYELDLSTNSRQILDSSGSLSDAIYFPGSDSIVYYSYGSYSASNTNPQDAGYYLFDPASGNRKLLLQYISDLGPHEAINGFDVSTDGKKLLIAVARKNKEPLIVEYDFAANRSDTLGIEFDSTDLGIRPALWLRYNRDATKILYCNYPLGAISSTGYPGNFSEIGIIDRKALTKVKLKTNPVNVFVGISLFPAWSPDEKMIVYGNAKLAGDGSVGYGYRVCILTRLP